jgi:predicted nucleic acid-binding protein
LSDFLIDTCALSELLKTQRDTGVVEWFNNTPQSRLFVSVLTLGELRRGVDRLESGKRRDVYERWLTIDLAERFKGRVLAFDAVAADVWGALDAKTSLRGRTLPTTDAMLAATALSRNLTIVTRNEDDFAGTDVTLHNPWSDVTE